LAQDDAGTGLLAGIPDRPGKVAIVVTATIDREVRSLDARSLSWGGKDCVHGHTADRRRDPKSRLTSRLDPNYRQVSIWNRLMNRPHARITMMLLQLA